jgi:AcrR family transcriptional regulator
LKRNKEAMRQRIVKESITLFLRKGFQGTAMEEITDAVNLTKGAIYWYFKSKDELLEAILQEWEKAYLDGLIASVNGVEGTFLDRFRQYHKYAWGYAGNHPELCMVWTILVAEIAGSGLRAESKFREGLDRYIEFVKGLVDSGKAELVIKEDLDSYVLANSIIGMQNGLFLQWYLKQNDLMGPQLARAFSGVLLSGITVKGDSLQGH